MENSKPVFRGAMGGYNKNDVNNYIASLSESFEKEKENYAKQLDDLIELVNSLRAKESEKSSDTEKGAAPAEELIRANSVIDAQTKKLEEKDSEIEELKSELTKKDDEIEKLKNALSRFSDCEEKLREYDLMSQKMGELMMKATSSAEQIKADAEIEAAKTLRESEEKNRELQKKEKELSDSLDARYTAAVAAINRKLNELVNEGFDALNSSMKSADAEISATLENRRLAAKAAVLRTAESLPELKALAGIEDGNDKR